MNQPGYFCHGIMRIIVLRGFSYLPGQAYYNYMQWGMAHVKTTYDFMAEEDKGQFIYVSPEKNLVIVRNGIEFGDPSAEWLELFYEFANQF